MALRNVSAPEFAVRGWRAFSLWFSLAVLLLLSTDASALVLQGQFMGRDPSRITKCNGRYYVYATGPNILMFYSDDLIHWTRGQDVMAPTDNANGVPQWARTAVPGNTGNVVWAPDMVYFNGLYHLYWAFSTFGTAESVIGLYTSPTLDPRDPNYKWTDQGPVVTSRRNVGGVPNAIDPCPVLDASGDLWLCWGSYNGYGIGLTRLDDTTGLRLSPNSTVYHIASSSIEASYILYHGGYYYLFFNLGSCCAGANSTYHILMGRSTSITGPYLDKNGVSLVNGSSNGGGTLFLASIGNKIGPGHMGLYSEGGIDRFTYHLESDGTNYGQADFNIETLIWGPGGWPVAGTDLPNGTYRLVNKATGMALGVQNDSTADGAPLNQNFYSGDIYQRWTITATPGGTPQTGYDGYYRLTNTGSGKVADLFQCNPANGTAVDQYPWFNNNCQRWLIEQTSDGYYRIVSRGGGGVMNASNIPASEGDVVNEWSWTGADSQKWAISAVEAPPTLSVNDVTASEGNSGQTDFTFTVTLSKASATPVTVQCRTVDDTATAADGDFTAVPLTTLTLPANTISATFTVPVNGDDKYERDERFLVFLSNSTGATIADNQGVGTIQNEDAPPAVAINDVALPEGDSGTTAFTFTVTRIGNTGLPLTVFYQTTDGTATVADNDYTAIPQGTLTIEPDQPSGQISVQVNGDATVEPDEQFTVDLYSPSEATITDGQGVGAILNDDRPPATMEDVVDALKMAGGLSTASSADLFRLNVGEPDTPLIDLLDAILLARKVSGLNPNP